MTKARWEQINSPLSLDKEKCWSTVILHVDQPSPHSRGMGWHSHDVQTWHKSTSHSLSPPSLLDPWGRALRGGSSELDWGRMEWVDVSGLMRSNTHKEVTVISAIPTHLPSHASKNGKWMKGSKGASKQSCHLPNTQDALLLLPVYYAEIQHSTATQKEKWQMLH